MRCAWVLMVVAMCLGGAGPGLARAQPERPEQPEHRERPDRTTAKTGYEARTVVDSFGRDVEYYLSHPPRGDVESGELPLVLMIQGSGCGSVFGVTPSGQIYGGLHNLLLGPYGGRVRVLVVEKPGVAFGDQAGQPGQEPGCSEEFLREHTVERWAEALRAAVEDAAAQPGVDGGRVLVMGHSEGADMAAHLVAGTPGIATHVAALSGAGITQLFDMVTLAWAEREPGEPVEQRQARVDSVYETFARISADPDSTTAMAWGHPHRRWSSFMSSSPSASLLRIAEEQPGMGMFLAQGTADRSSPVESFDAAVAQLLVAGAEPVVRRVPGVGHGFGRPGDQGVDGLRGVMSEAVDWFLGDG